ncbi:MAG TPA: hypothetical protein VK907_01860 [Phnomibacter sp.]|nr:hypothetical protein [Phnomibacter sp.]
MRKLFFGAILLVIAGVAISQDLSQVTIQGGKSFRHFGIAIDRQVLLRISDDGKILEYGMEERSLRNPNFFSPKLQPFLGRVDKYDNHIDSMIQGKVRSIGTANITYYPSNEDESRRGKIRTIGTLMLDYYDYRSNEAQKGKLKQIGRNMIDYYAPFENEAIKGKLKTVGPTNITYYTSFDDKAIAGKVKTIGANNYTWFTSTEQQRMGGALKSGQQRAVANQVTYIIQ